MAKTHRRTRWPRAIEFCNTVGGKADRALKCRFAADDPKRILRNAQSQERLPRAAMLPAAPPSAASNSLRPMVTVIRPSRARCVKATIPRHERAVFAFKEGRMLPHVHWRP